MTIHCALSEKSIDDAIREIERYGKSLESRSERLVNELAEEVKKNAVNELNSHYFDDEKFDETINSLTIEKVDQFTRNVLAGGGAVWIEFGTGVVANPVGVGGYAHPKAAELGMYGIGEYGHGWGANPWGWYYYNENGEKIHTYGIPATMFMYHSAWFAKAKIPEIARRIFRT